MKRCVASNVRSAKITTQIYSNKFGFTEVNKYLYTMEAEKLRSLIEDKGIKQTWIAKKLGVKKEQVYQWVSGKAGIPEKYLENLNKLLGITENEKNS